MLKGILFEKPSEKKSFTIGSKKSSQCKKKKKRREKEKE